jgi:hypothetical protein
MGPSGIPLTCAPAPRPTGRVQGCTPETYDLQTGPIKTRVPLPWHQGGSQHISISPRTCLWEMLGCAAKIIPPSWAHGACAQVSSPGLQRPGSQAAQWELSRRHGECHTAHVHNLALGGEGSQGCLQGPRGRGPPQDLGLTLLSSVMPSSSSSDPQRSLARPPCLHLPLAPGPNSHSCSPCPHGLQESRKTLTSRLHSPVHRCMPQAYQSAASTLYWGGQWG